MLTRLLAATVAGGIAFFIVGFLIYGLVLDPLVFRPALTPEGKAIMVDPPVWVPLILSNFVSAFLYAYIFDQWAGIRTFVGGMRGGAIIMFLFALGMNLSFAAFMKFYTSVTPMIADVVGAVVMGAIVGGVIGMVLGMMKKD